MRPTCIVIALALGACAGRPPPTPRPAPVGRPATPTPAPAAACAVARALRPACGTCATSQCCNPPVAVSHELLQNLGCHLGCRRPSPQRDRLPPEQYIEILSRCLAGCDRLLPDPSGQAAPLDACITEFCLTECLGD